MSNNYYEGYNADTTNWRMAAEALMKFIKDNVRVIGFDEIEAYNKAKKIYDTAKLNDNKKKFSKNHRWANMEPYHDAF